MVAIVIEQSQLVGEQGELGGTFYEFGHEKVWLQGSVIKPSRNPANSVSLS